MTSERAGIADGRVRQLADEITEAQRREITEMNWLIEDIELNGKVEIDVPASCPARIAGRSRLPNSWRPIAEGALGTQ